MTFFRKGSRKGWAVVRKVLREPLVHFLALALLIFVAYGILIRSDTTAPGRIVITQAKIEQIAGLFARTWQRPPTPAELKGSSTTMSGRKSTTARR